MYSGGLGSYDAARMAIEAHGDAVELLFTDTLHEDVDLYRFLIEGAADLLGGDVTHELRAALAEIQPIEAPGEVDRRKVTLPRLAELAHAHWPRLHWISRGETLWEAFYRNRAMGSSRMQFCSRELKVQPSEAFLAAHYTPGEVTLHFGLDWTETARLNKVKASRAPHLVSTAYHDSQRSHSDVAELLAARGIALPRLYALGFTHNNCSGFCVKGGQSHFAHLLDAKPELYAFAEQGEEDFRQFIGKNVSILADRRGVKRGQKRRPLTMRQFRQEIEAGREADPLDIGACGCYVG